MTGSKEKLTKLTVARSRSSFHLAHSQSSCGRALKFGLGKVSMLYDRLLEDKPLK